MADQADESFDNLENLLSPFSYEGEIPLPKTSPEVPGGIYLSGFISQDCTWGCCFNHSVVKCFPVEKFFEENYHNGGVNHSCNASVAVSSASYTFTGGRITCATELAIHNQRTSSGARKLLLGISYSVENNNKDLRGAVVIFDPLRCVPMKWIEIPEPVSSITVLSHFEEGGSNRPFFNETMMAMVGIAAVGLRGGAVIIVDLGLDDPNLNTVSVSNSKDISTLTYRLLNVNPHEYVIATKRHKAVSKRCLISLKFTNEPRDDVVSDAFHYCKPSGESILMLHKLLVAVTCVEYVPVIGSLLVGFTCGGFQIWRVNSMELQFSSDLVHVDRNMPVFGFSFQQPVDDPKNYCYVWVMYGNNSIECSTSHVELYSLYYESKTYVENFGYTYDGFKQCSKRLTIPLIDDFLPNDGEAEDSIRCSARPLRIWSQPDSELMFCAWEVGRGGVFYFGAFDLNQWYSNHTREQIMYHPVTGLSPYWVALPIEIPDISSLMLDVRIIPKSLMRWENPHATKLDVHYFPASISFRAVGVTNTGIFAIEHFGIQEKLVRIMLKDGSNLMIKPAAVKDLLHRYGLEPVFPHSYSEQLSEMDRDRFYIFSVLLESRRTTVITRLAAVWLDGSYANVGCTVDLIIDWIASYMLAIRSMADEHWENIFAFVDDVLPPETVHFINYSNFAWTSLYNLLQTLMAPTEVYSVRGLELEDLEFGLGKLVQYSAALLMMYKAKLLPERDNPLIRDLTAFYQRRRNEAKDALQASRYIDNQYKETHPLMIDHLMDSLATEENIYEEWHVAEGEQLYPPQHVGYLLNMFMWADADPRAISRIFMYFLFDLNYMYAFANNPPNSEVERKVRGDFKAVMNEASDEYSDVFCLWLLDHGIHDEVLVHVKEKDRLFETDGLPWCAVAVALTAAGFENDIAELLLKSCPHILAKLLFCLMTSSAGRFGSLSELMVSSNLNTDEDLLQQFFEISETRGRLGEFIRTKSKELPYPVKEALLAFLNSSDSLKRLSLLLMYYVQTEDYQKLDEEFTRVRSVLTRRRLSNAELNAWTFQENYITHLLDSTKGSIVEKFLGLQTSQTMRLSKPTITIKAVAVQPTTPPQLPDRIRNESKLPPQLRRLKLSETISSDPLSPLRRYAGRIQQSAVSAGITDSEDSVIEKRSRRYSRKSVARRDSFRSTRLSLGNTIVNASRMNDTVSCDDLNKTRSNVDLINLLRTPAVNHRLNNSQIVGRKSVPNDQSQMEITGIICDETLPQPAPRLSIMKEKDPSKPKTVKKVELCLENLSLQSTEDEKELTIYEDADDNILEQSCDVFHSPNSKSASDTSLNEEKTLLGSESESLSNSPCAVGIRSVSASGKETFSSSTHTHHPHFSAPEFTRSSRSRSPTRELFAEAQPESVGEPAQRTTRGTRFTTPLFEAAEITSMEVEANPVVGSEVESIPDTPCAAKIQRESEPCATPLETESDQQTLETSSTHQPPVSKLEHRNTRSSSRSRTPTREILEESHIEPVIKPAARPTKFQSTRSTTPTRESVEGASVEVEANPVVGGEFESIPDTPCAPVIQSETEPGSEVDQRTMETSSTHQPPVSKLEHRNTRRSSRSRTPTREILEESHIEPVIKPAARPTKSQSTRSTTPTRESAVEGASVEVEAKSLVGGEFESIPDTPCAPAIQSKNEPESEVDKRTQKTSSSPIHPPSSSAFERRNIRRSSRSRTPTREILEESHNESVITLARRTTRSTRSTTPTRDIVTEETSLGIDTRPTRRVTRATRSRTPTRDLEERQEESPTISTRRGTRATKTPTRETLEESVDEERKPVRRGARASKIPTREITEESVYEESKPPTRRSKRTARTAMMEIMEESPDEESKSVRPGKRASKTPTRELMEESMNEERKPVLRGKRVSKTPTRELVEESMDMDEERRPVLRGKRASKTPTREIIEDASEDVEDKPIRRSTGRASLSSSSASKPSSSFSFEVSTVKEEDSVEESQSLVEEELDTASAVLTMGKRNIKRRLKYFDHHQDLSTVIEDASSADPSVLEATILPSVPSTSQTQTRRIKGIRQRPMEVEMEEEIEPVKPSKRRKATVKDSEDILDTLSEVGSEVSTRSNRSTSSKKSSTSKGKSTRRRGRSSSQSTS